MKERLADTILRNIESDKIIGIYCFAQVDIDGETRYCYNQELQVTGRANWLLDALCEKKLMTRDEYDPELNDPNVEYLCIIGEPEETNERVWFCSIQHYPNTPEEEERIRKCIKNDPNHYAYKTLEEINEMKAKFLTDYEYKKNTLDTINAVLKNHIDRLEKTQE